MLLICSSDYIESELTSEIGKIPPAFLPLGGKRLYEHQLACCKSNFTKKIISLPYDYKIPDFDVKRLDDLGLEVIRVPKEFSIGETIQYCINISGSQGKLSILYGDTVIEDNDIYHMSDVVGVSYTTSNYHWYNVENNKDLVYNGFFGISSAKELVRYIALCNGDYLAALKSYSDNYKVLKQHKVNKWYDFGHSQTFYKSRTKFTTERAFNHLIIENNIVEKTSSRKNKISAEANWFATIPFYLKVYTPQYLGNFVSNQNGFYGYRTEYLNLCSLSELFVFGNLPTKSWASILGSCNKYLIKCQLDSWPASFNVQDYLNSIYVKKSKKRLEKYCQDNKFDPDVEVVFNNKKMPSINYIMNKCISRVMYSDPVPAILHGDFCFSNIFFDFRSESIKIIDPRAIDFDGKFTIYGDLRYDLAKILHSYIGYYDCIISQRYDLAFTTDKIEFNLEEKKTLSIESVMSILNVIDIKKHHVIEIVILLFLSMLPLHYDSSVRQKAFLANALRLFSILEDME
ncbi:TPA: hypothetical protein ACWV7L_005327 [Salmonella enterica subsp. enterica serovar Muenchen]